MPAHRNFWKMIGICLLFAGLIWIVFAQTLGYRFVNFDDESYVYGNPVVSHGLTLSAIDWAFTHIVSHNWHPLTTLSHMLDCQLFDLRPGGHHFTNVMLHTVASILLFAVLYNATAALWQSAFVATLFAIHPLHVESVAWIAERKDVLSAVFFVLTLGAYVRYARKPTLARYLLTLFLFALGLMSKPMLVTAPILFLVLDYWPLDRIHKREDRGSRTGAKRTIGQLVAEKTPLLILSAGSSAVTILIQKGGIDRVENLSLAWRVANAFVSYLIYVRQMFWPSSLAVFYPHRGSGLPLWEIATAAVLFIAITAIAVFLRKKRPYLLSGWLWYVGTLIPVIGLVQVGTQAHADRYTYLPQIGLYLAVTWGVADLSRKWTHRQLVLSTVAAVVVGLLTWRASIQTSFWRDSESLWKHALAAAVDNDLAHERLASALLDENQTDEAIVQAQLAVNLRPNSGEAQNDLGVALSRRGQPAAALTHLWTALEKEPALPKLNYNIANALLAKGELEQAIVYYQKQLEIDPNFAEAHNNFANVLLQKAEPDQAISHLTKALALKPDYAQAYNNLAIALSQKGEMNQALGQWKNTLAIDPNNLEAHCNLAWVLATSPADSIRNGAAALEHAQRALQISKESSARVWRLVAAANAELGRFDAALDAAERGLWLAKTQDNPALVQTLESNISLFRSHSPLRDVTQTK